MNEQQAKEAALLRWRKLCKAERAVFAALTSIEHKMIPGELYARHMIVFYRAGYPFAVLRRGEKSVRLCGEKDTAEILPRARK